MGMYSELEQEFNEPMSAVGLDFKNEYSKALDAFEGFDFPREEKCKAIQGVLREILEQYIKSKPKTKAGRWGRIGARIALIFEPLVKIFRK